MIIRKPYAFLIKNFKKIHIVLLLLSIFVAYKLFDVNRFLNEFMRLGTYDMFTDPVSKHISIWLNLVLILLIVGSGALLLLLHYKKKPWKIYLVPIIEYFVLILVLSMIKGFFNVYSSEIEVTDLRLSKDLLLIFMILQLPVIAVFVVRVFGLDIKRFQFNTDQEFLELSEADREEMEIGLNVDKYTFIRGFKRVVRHLKYFYLEHRGICRTIIGIVGFVFLFQMGKLIFVTNRTYSEGDSYSINGYTFKVNNAYFTDKDFNGNVISEKSNFVIVDLSITNHQAERTVYLEYFHLKNSTSDFVTTRRVYANEFIDLGTAYESTTKIPKDVTLNCIIIYKVPGNLKKNKFALFYQEKQGGLRKIKLKVKDVSVVSEGQELSIGDEIPLPFKNNADELRIDYVNLESESVSYSTKSCSNEKCYYDKKYLSVDDTFKILKIDFSSGTYEAKNMIDFLKNYGKLNYKDSEDEEHILEIENPIKEAYYGKTVFIKVPVDFEEAKEAHLDLIIRDKHYIYRLMEDSNEEGNNEEN